MKPSIQLSLGSVKISDPKNELLNEIYRQIEITDAVNFKDKVIRAFEFTVETNNDDFSVFVSGVVTYLSSEAKARNAFSETGIICNIETVKGCLKGIEASIEYNGNNNFTELIERKVENLC